MNPFQRGGMAAGLNRVHNESCRTPGDIVDYAALPDHEKLWLDRPTFARVSWVTHWKEKVKARCVVKWGGVAAEIAPTQTCNQLE